AGDARDAVFTLLDETSMRVDAVSDIVAAPALEDDLRFIDALYRAVLSRAPDADGLDRWTTHLRAGGSRLDLLAELSASSEARARGVPRDLRARVLQSHR